MGLFDKKYCDVCGDKIGLFGNRKLEDGNLCKNCAAKLSPWFTGRRHTGLNDIRQQLEAREANQAKVSAFHSSKTYGYGFRKAYIDEAAGTFAVCCESDWNGGNPDIIPISCVKDCTTRTDEHRTERKYRDKDGKMVSYTPPIYDYSYDFDCTLTLEHPYIDEIRFQINKDAIKEGHVFKADFTKTMNDHQNLCNEISLFFKNYGKVSAAPAASVSAPVPPVPAAAAAPVSEEWECPGCTATNKGGKFCQYCGTPRP